MDTDISVCAKEHVEWDGEIPGNDRREASRFAMPVNEA